jgi:hypothetical protein
LSSRCGTMRRVDATTNARLSHRGQILATSSFSTMSLDRGAPRGAPRGCRRSLAAHDHLVVLPRLPCRRRRRRRAPVRTVPGARRRRAGRAILSLRHLRPDIGLPDPRSTVSAMVDATGPTTCSTCSTLKPSLARLLSGSGSPSRRRRESCRGCSRPMQSPSEPSRLADHFLRRGAVGVRELLQAGAAPPGPPQSTLAMWPTHRR